MLPLAFIRPETEVYSLAVYVVIAWAIRLLMVPVILRRQFAPGTSLAWLGVVFLHPYVGATLYVLIGGNRLGRGHAERHREAIARTRHPAHRDRHHHQHHASALELHPAYEPMALQAEKMSGLPILDGNGVELIHESARLVDRLVADIDAAESHVHLLYYLFAPDATGRRVAEAIGRAARRGVRCRVLADAVASRAFFHRRRGLAQSLRAAGVEVVAALPVALLRRKLARMDFRNHRKLAVIDRRVAYAGSHNLINPDYGGRRGAPWHDLTGRYTGPVVNELALVFAEDWAAETGDEAVDAPASAAIHDAAESPPPALGGVPAQVVPTGPSTPDATFRRLLLAAVQCARHRVHLTTPYFVPDEPTLLALLMAVDRGVEVTVNVPARPDNLLTAAASQAHFDTLLRGGVRVCLYHPGLLHAKIVTVDDAFAVFGSANIDVRSFNLNFELSVVLYGRSITERLRQAQAGYVAESSPVDPAQWARRPVIRQYADRAIALLSPLL